MGDFKEEEQTQTNNNKRSREDDENSVPESKLARVDSPNSVDDYDFTPESTVDASKESSPVVMRIQNDLLDIFDDTESDPVIQGLDSVIKSFEEEILFPDQAAPEAAVVTSDFGEESRPDLGYLLEASDDELGLPPSFSSGGFEEQKIEDFGFGTDESGSGSGSGSGSVSLENIELGFDEMANFEPYKFGEAENNDFITLGGGLFDSFEAGDVSDFLWRPESLSAS